MAEQDINTCCVEGRSPASLCSRFTMWELGQQLWRGPWGRCVTLPFTLVRERPGTPARDVRDRRDERDACWSI